MKRKVKSKAPAKKTAKKSVKTVKKPKKRKNVSQSVQNGILIITSDNNLYATDGKGKKVRMATVVDSNRADELAIVKYTTSKKNGKTYQH